MPIPQTVSFYTLIIVKNSKKLPVSEMFRYREILFCTDSLPPFNVQHQYLGAVIFPVPVGKSAHGRHAVFAVIYPTAKDDRLQVEYAFAVNYPENVIFQKRTGIAQRGSKNIRNP